MINHDVHTSSSGRKVVELCAENMELLIPTVILNLDLQRERRKATCPFLSTFGLTFFESVRSPVSMLMLSFCWSVLGSLHR